MAMALAGCATQDVVFVTKTSIGIDVDSQSASVAYDRTEGYVAPRYPNRQAVPVFASVATDGKLIGRNVKQVYATGNAARIVSGGQALQDPVAQQAIYRNVGLDPTGGAGPGARAVPASPPPPRAGVATDPKKTMFFGTGSVIGIKVGYGPSAAVDAFTFGFKRKEVSIIPHDESEQDLPSVMASLDTGTAVENAATTSFTVKQFFATGAAAESLASDRQIQRQFKDEAKARLGQYRDDERSQRDDALASLACLSELDDEQAKKVWLDVKDRALFDKEAIDQLMAASKPSEARTVYAKEIGITDAASSTITASMKGHATFVCSLPKSA